MKKKVLKKGTEKYKSIFFAAVVGLLGYAVVVITVVVVIVTVLPCCVIVLWTVFAQKETEHPDTD